MPTSRNIELNLSIAAAAACVILLAPWFYIFASTDVANRLEKWAHFGTYVGGVLSPLLAFAALLGLLHTIYQERGKQQKEQRDRDDAHYFDHAVRCLERAFQAISLGERGDRPVRDRLAWLTCARLILAAKQAFAMIGTESRGLRNLYIGEEEHWRHRFYELFEPNELTSFAMDPSYFGSAASDAAPIDERSVRVIYDFMEWPEEVLDPIDGVARYTPDEIRGMPIRMRGLRDYLLTLRPIRPNS